MENGGAPHRSAPLLGEVDGAFGGGSWKYTAEGWAVYPWGMGRGWLIPDGRRGKVSLTAIFVDLFTVFVIPLVGMVNFYWPLPAPVVFLVTVALGIAGRQLWVIWLSQTTAPATERMTYREYATLGARKIGQHLLILALVFDMVAAIGCLALVVTWSPRLWWGVLFFVVAALHSIWMLTLWDEDRVRRLQHRHR